MADDLDILDLPEAKTALNIPLTTNDYDTELAQVITAASRFVDSVYGPVVEREVTKTVVSPAGTVWLDRPLTITSVTEYVSGTGSVLTAEDADTPGTYRIDLTTGALTRRSSWANTYWSGHEVVVVYQAGRYETTADVEPQFKEACAQAVIHLWQARGSGNGIGVLGGDGDRFGGVPYSPTQLRKNLIALLPDEWVGPAVA